MSDTKAEIGPQIKELPTLYTNAEIVFSEYYLSIIKQIKIYLKEIADDKIYTAPFVFDEYLKQIEILIIEAEEVQKKYKLHPTGIEKENLQEITE